VGEGKLRMHGVCLGPRLDTALAYSGVGHREGVDDFTAM